MTANLTSHPYATSRDFPMVDTNRADVAAIIAVFNADFTDTAVHPGDGSDLDPVTYRLGGKTARLDQRRDE